MNYVVVNTDDHELVDFDVKELDLRLDRGLTQSQLAFLCNVSKNTISSLERGEFLPGLPLIIKLCIVLDCKFSDLVHVWDRDYPNIVNL